MERYEDPFAKAMREVAGLIQFLIYRYETCPVKDRAEVLVGLQGRLQGVELSIANGRIKWVKSLLELAAYAIFCSVSKPE